MLFSQNSEIYLQQMSAAHVLYQAQTLHMKSGTLEFRL